MQITKLGFEINSSMKSIYSLLKQYDYETIKEYFDTVYGKSDNQRFDFESGYLCGTIENVDGHPVLVDLQFTQQHLPLGEQQ